MRFLVYGDLQATDGDSVLFSDPSQSLQHWRVRKFYRRVRKLVKEHGCEGVIDLGDTTDDRSSIPLTTLNEVSTGLTMLPDGPYNYKLTGNHEQFLRDTSIDNACLFEGYMQVQSGNEVVKLGETNLFFCSYPPSYAALEAWLVENIDKTRGPRVLFGHFQVKGTRMASGMALDGIPLELLKRNFDLVVLGHIHAHQYLADNVLYLGSPFQQDWGESGQKKFVGVYDVRAGSFDLVEVVGFPVYKTVSFPEFSKLQFDNEDRYRVQLTSHREAEAFFTHPEFKRGQPEYLYDQVSVTDDGEPVQTDWTFEAVTRRYVERIDPAKVGIDLDSEDLLDVGKTLAGL